MLASVPEGAVRKDIEDNVLSPIRMPRDDNRPRFRWLDVFRLAAVYRNDFFNRQMRKFVLDALESALAPALPRRKQPRAGMEFHSLIFEKPSALLPPCGNIQLGDYFFLNVDQIRADLNPRADLYARGLSRIEEKSDTLGGEAVFRNTRLPVRHVGGMAAKGEAVEDIVLDYPYLDEDDVAFAVLYHEAHPYVGRPRSAPGERVGKIPAG